MTEVKNYDPIIKLVHISYLKDGDTVLYMGVKRTVCTSEVKEGFTGWTYRGDPLVNSGENGKFDFKKRGFIQKVCYPRFILGEFYGYEE